MLISEILAKNNHNECTKYTVLVKCRVFAIKPGCTYDKEWLSKRLAVAFVNLM
jgi:hypothetical protein